MNITFSITDVLIHEVITKIFDHEVSRLKSYLLKNGVHAWLYFQLSFTIWTVNVTKQPYAPSLSYMTAIHDLSKMKLSK